MSADAKLSDSGRMLGDGDVVAGFRIVRPLAHGGMGMVYEAVQLSLSRPVALKIVAPELAGDERFRERFRREGLVQAALSHPHIVNVIDTGDFQGVLYLAMQLVTGPTLKQLIIARELDVGRTLRLMDAVASGLDAAHEADVVHRDVKPQNILIGRRDHPFLADFGLTKALGSRGRTRTGQVVGSLEYIAPEQIEAKPAGQPSDIYSFAAVLFECLTGDVPYPMESDAAVMHAHLHAPPPAVTERRADLPGELDELFARAMAKDPDQRYPSAGTMMEDVTEVFGDLTSLMTPPGPTTRPEPQSPRSPRASSRVTPQQRTRVDRLEGPRRPVPTAPPPVAEPWQRNLVAIGAAILVVAVAAGALAGHRSSHAKAAAASPAVAAGRNPADSYRSDVSRVMARLARTRSRERTKLQAAQAASTQAARARALSSAYGRAGRELASLSPPGNLAASEREVALRLDGCGTAYAELAAAAKEHDAEGFGRAEADASKADDDLNAAIGRLDSASDG